MDTFMKFMKRKGALLREEMAQGAQNPQDMAQPSAPDATPEQPPQGASQPPADDSSGVSPPAHDEDFAKLLSVMKEALPNLKNPENKKLVSNFIKLASGDSEDQSKGQKPEDQQGQEQAPPQAQGLGDQQGQAAPQPPEQTGSGPASPAPQQPPA